VALSRLLMAVEAMQVGREAMQTALEKERPPTE
jgi:hypothetical protein